MKYFISTRRKGDTKTGRSISGVDCEVSSQKAYDIYVKTAKVGNLNLVAIPNHTRGVEIRIGSGISTIIYLWGEDITDKECFQRRLSGRLHTDAKE